jgi:putative nucleotidyltransferase with HDIG domain
MKSVLVVDDEAAMRTLMTRWVRASGHLVSAASGADEALDLMLVHTPAVAVCDVRMPGHDGLWLAERIRTDFPETAVVMATGARDTDPRIAEHAGAIDYLLKPFGRDRLRFALDRGFDWHRSAAERREWRCRLALELRQRRQELISNIVALERSGDRPVESLLAMIEASDAEALDHARRVAELSAKVARAFGLSEAHVSAIRDAALLHDIGKLALPEAILHKPAALSLEECAIIRQHPEIASEVLMSKGLEDAATIVNSAKEWYDGSGYPNALSGDAIPIGGRIVAIADAYDAMTRRQIYRDPIPSSEAVREILRCSDSQFDPRIVSCLLEVLTESADRS